MIRRLRLPLVLAATAVTTVSCFNSDEGRKSDPNAVGETMTIVEVQNGFGRLLPYVVAVPDPVTGLPTAQLREIRSLDDLLENRPTVLNPILPPATWPTEAVNPASNVGNHFVAVRFSRQLQLDSVLDPTASGLANNGLTGAISVVAYDQATGLSEPVKGRGFIDGYTYFGVSTALERWVAPGESPDGNDALLVARSGGEVVPGIGFPGTNDPVNGVVDGSFINASSLINPYTFVFVVDEDENLATYETLPEGRVLRIVINGADIDCDDPQAVVTGVRSLDGRVLEEGGVAVSQVGADAVAPQPLLDGVGGSAVTCPENLSSDLPCDVEIRFSFDEACQPHSIGPLPDVVPPALSNEFTVEFLPPVGPGQPPPGSTVTLPYTVEPVSPYNFTEYIVRPVVNFPGSDPFGAQAEATVTYFHNAATDLFLNQASSSLIETQIDFSVGANCPGLVNVPVAPGAIVVASNGGGTTGGIRVLDLDGFGQGTGDPTHDYQNPFYNVSFNSSGQPVAGDISKFPFNPNLGVPGIFPPLSADTTSIAGGSKGVFTLATDSTLRTQLVTSEQVGTIGDMLLGHPLDLAFNNFECLSGGQNLCANAAFQLHPLAGGTRAGNSISHSPHPNPPRIRFAPSCFAPLIQTEEPTFPGTPPATNLLVFGDSFGTIGGFGPSGLLSESAVYAGFWGPSPTALTCPTFTLRQQIGHFLYVLDTSGERVVVLNSNRMTVIDEIPVSDPRDLAIAPDMNLLAVSNRGTNTVTFIDTDPRSQTFHKVIKTTILFDSLNSRQGLGPTEIVWQPDGEDVLVLCEDSNSMAIITGSGLEVRKIIPGVNQPRLLAVTNRDNGIGFQTGLYYAYVISQTGEMTIFESGPDGNQGIGFDDFIGKPSLEAQTGFPSAATMCMNPGSTQNGVFIGYRLNGQGRVSELWLDNAPVGALPISFPPGVVVDPNFRSKEWKIKSNYIGVNSGPALSQVIDLAVDDLNNLGGQTHGLLNYGSGTVFHSGKSMHRPVPGGQIPASYPRFLLAANSNGTVHVFNLSTGENFVSPIQIPGAAILCHYWRQ